MILAVAGVGVGLAVALAATRLLCRLLFRPNARDPIRFAGVALLMLTLALAATRIPAPRALRGNRMPALRTE
jgi:hypothetical protein